jgi:hypothetical protein
MARTVLSVSSVRRRAVASVVWTAGASCCASALGCDAKVETSTDASDGVEDSGTTGGGMDATSQGGACADGSLVFAIHASMANDSGPPAFCLGAPDSCSTDWLSIHPADAGAGAAFRIDQPCEAQCRVCEAVACAALCASAAPLGPEGAQRSWDGTYYTSETCAGDLPCFEMACAPPGRYLATMCAHADLGQPGALLPCEPASAATCVDVAFSWPPAEDAGRIEGTIAP